jgi:hypothetical protein
MGTDVKQAQFSTEMQSITGGVVRRRNDSGDSILDEGDILEADI